jgi:hypothetical protein
LALTSISAQTNASINGRLLARNGAVTLDSNTFTRPSCQAAGVTATTTVGGATTVVGGTTPVGVTVSIPTIPGTGADTRMTLTVGLVAVLLGTAAIIGVRRGPRRSTSR